VSSIHQIAPKVKFIGISLAHGIDPVATPEYLRYFLNSSNHKTGVPLDMIAYHHYAFPKYNDSDMWGSVLNSTKQFLNQVIINERIRKELAPDTQLNIEEFGTIVGTGRETNPPPLPDSYWNSQAVQYGYAFAFLSNLGGVHALGMSQFVGYPGNFPSLPMIDWKDGKVNARYWALRILVEELGLAHGKRKINVVKSSSSNSDIVYTAAFNTTRNNISKRKVLLINLVEDNVIIHIEGMKGGQIVYVDTRTGAKGEPVYEAIARNSILIGGYAVAIVTYPHQ